MQIRGYSAVRSLFTVAALVVPTVLVVLLRTGSDSLGDRRLAFLAAVVVAIPAIGAASFRLLLKVDPQNREVHVTRRWWYGAERHWVIPEAELTAWYYVTVSQQLVLHRSGEQPLRFTLMTNGAPERLAAWGTQFLPRPADIEAADRDAKRAKLVIGLSVGLGVPVCGVVLFAIMMLTLT